MSSFDTDMSCQHLEDIIQKTLRAGASAADAVLVEGTSLSVSWANGKLESLERSEGGEIGLRVLIGKRQASVATTDRSAEAVDEAIERAVSMARLAPEDPFCGLAQPDEIAKTYPTLELADDSALEAPLLMSLASEAEEAALAVPGVTRCEGAHIGASSTQVTLAASNGFAGTYRRTRYGLGVSALAGEGTAMERDGDDASAVFFRDMPSAASIGRTAGERAVSLLGSRRMPSCQVPVIFDPRESRGLLGEFAGAILGSGIARGTSFLKDSLGKQIFSKDIQITDDPFRARGLRTKAFDGEGLLPQKRQLVENGVLKTWVLDLRSARQLGLKSTGHAQRGTSGVPSPSPTNLYMEAGRLAPQELWQGLPQGFYVTETMGMGVNGVTGDYSLAARGFWIDKGELAFPVNEMTIAGNLKDMFQHLTAANDLVFLYGINAPTIRIDGMTIAGL